MQSVYRIVDRTGREAFRGKRSAVARKLESRSLRETIEGLSVERGKLDPVIETNPPKWRAVSTAAGFLAFVPPR